MGEAAQTIVLTGAAGNIGRKLRAHWGDRHRIRAVDCNPRGDESILRADLATQVGLWSSSFAGADTVVHLAANAHPLQPWEEARRSIATNFNIYNVAHRANVRRIVYASSSHVLGGYRDKEGPNRLTPDLAPDPGMMYKIHGESGSTRHYAISKLWCEELGRCYAEFHEMIVIAVRIGWVQLGENLPESFPTDTDEWTRLMWLSNRDLCHLFDCCLVASPHPRFLIVNGMSANRGMRWDIGSALQSIGYRPQDGIQ
ncbi:MAG: NAD-dependent epimerase/dehydratase family protein [Planctomycetota bacterium]